MVDSPYLLEENTPFASFREPVMTISLKSTIVFSVTLAALLNVWQFASTYTPREDAFAPSWATASADTQAPSPVPKALPIATRPAIKAPPPLSDTPAVTVAPPVPIAPVVNPDVANVTTELAQNGLNSSYASLYLGVESDTGTPWQLLAAIHKVETNQSGSTDRTSSAGATGPMQFLPATFDSYAAPGHPDVTSLTDAMLAAGRYLAANGAAGGDYSNAVYHYNHSWDYVDRVLDIADRLGL
jgi:membrane-bound lytic murein transglycosylase B